MSLAPHSFDAIPEETPRVARAAFPHSTRVMQMRDHLFLTDRGGSLCASPDTLGADFTFAGVGQIEPSREGARPFDEGPAVCDSLAEEVLIADNSTILQRPSKAIFGRKHAATNNNSSKSKGEEHG